MNSSIFLNGKKSQVLSKNKSVRNIGSDRLSKILVRVPGLFEVSGVANGTKRDFT